MDVVLQRTPGSALRLSTSSSCPSPAGATAFRPRLPATSTNRYPTRRSALRSSALPAAPPRIAGVPTPTQAAVTKPPQEEEEATLRRLKQRRRWSRGRGLPVRAACAGRSRAVWAPTPSCPECLRRRDPRKNMTDRAEKESICRWKRKKINLSLFRVRAGSRDSTWPHVFAIGSRHLTNTSWFINSSSSMRVEYFWSKSNRWKTRHMIEGVKDCQIPKYPPPLEEPAAQSSALQS
ncbi:hypothetical protein GQ55_5G133300 [Panicum hallii var. hallii]|uniref:Uncharacterized protein n=1 Tax=Panicum hallii var. hallii TaxID=1504633 RepID=A0A2T7DFV1_9POAL|nr:hypothetical protein GQ55_5G133300 [Panicum hallii var. hallii]